MISDNIMEKMNITIQLQPSGCYSRDSSSNVTRYIYMISSMNGFLENIYIKHYITCDSWIR